ncbi:hypothetical protein QIA34_06020 (plasmid) [Borreliella yangtzensis]|uniref:dGTP triphosphohydrolase n=1 Tax=Borreliella yangtzensis TaxID=683292 RepID=A0ABR6PBQ2_9SPIR|nr:dGTP triphosphohydrolase [Borreliella yangtzensis]
MYKKITIFIVSAVFAVISSCKNYADLKQDVKGKVKGFKEGIEKKVKQGIKQTEQKVKGFLKKEVKDISDEIAKKLHEEESANNGGQGSKEKKGQEQPKQEQKRVDQVAQQENQKKLMQGDDPNNSVLSSPPIFSTSGHSDTPVLKSTVQNNSGSSKVKEKEKQKEDKEDNIEEQSEEVILQAQTQEQTEEEDKVKVKAKIKDLTNKIDKINKDIDSIKHQSWFVEEVERVIVGAQEVIDKVTGPIYDHFTDDSKQAIYHTWGLTEEDDEELAKLLKELGDTRDSLRKNLNEGNQAATVGKPEPKLKENVRVSEIESDLDKLKSKLGEVKEYLKDQSNFETIKGYINDTNSNRISEDDE